MNLSHNVKLGRLNHHRGKLADNIHKDKVKNVSNSEDSLKSMFIQDVLDGLHE